MPDSILQGLTSKPAEIRMVRSHHRAALISSTFEDVSIRQAKETRHPVDRIGIDPACGECDGDPSRVHRIEEDPQRMTRSRPAS